MKKVVSLLYRLLHSTYPLIKENEIDFKVNTDLSFGEISSNIPFIICSYYKNSIPIEVAHKLKSLIIESNQFGKIFSSVQASEPGYLNFSIDENFIYQHISELNDSHSNNKLMILSLLNGTHPNPNSVSKNVTFGPFQAVTKVIDDSLDWYNNAENVDFIVNILYESNLINKTIPIPTFCPAVDGFTPLVLKRIDGSPSAYASLLSYIQYNSERSPIIVVSQNNNHQSLVELFKKLSATRNGTQYKNVIVISPNHFKQYDQKISIAKNELTNKINQEKNSALTNASATIHRRIALLIVEFLEIAQTDFNLTVIDNYIHCLNMICLLVSDQTSSQCFINERIAETLKKHLHVFNTVAA